MSVVRSMYKVLSRKKIVTSDTLKTSELAKVLTTIDLTALSIGSTLGVGVYVLAGQVSKNLAGPAVVLSFLVAAIASVFAGLCYAEFGARVPKAGSAYVYSYVCVGELVAFIIGWNLILEYVIGSASVVKGMSTYLDDLIGNKMSKAFNETMHMDVEGFAEYPDFFALGVTMVFATAVALGAKESTLVNNIFTFINLAVVLFVVISGLWKVDAGNWALPNEKYPEIPAECGESKQESCGTGGFAPYGIPGIIKGAASCFYGFIGFDTIATAGEEAKTPQKSIPLATVLSLFVIFVAYFSISTVLTMMLPYFDQNTKAPFPYAFDKIGWPVARYIVSFGAIFGLCASLFGALFPLPRIIYAMSSDGLIFKFLGNIHPRFQTPLVGTLIAGLLTGILSMIFELEQLFSMMSIGTLLAYSMVAACVLILRYDHDEEDDDEVMSEEPLTFSNVIHEIFNFRRKRTTKLTANITTIGVTVYSVLSLAVGICLSSLENELSVGEPWAIALLAIFLILAVFTAIILASKPVTTKKLTFQVPLIPWIPCLSIMINLYLMAKLDVMTWVRFAVWMVIGMAIYFGYGIWNSSQRVRDTTAIEPKGELNKSFAQDE